MNRENRLVVKHSGTEGAGAEEIWFLFGDRMRWVTRRELSEFPEKVFAALTKEGFKITMTQLQDALTVKHS